MSECNLPKIARIIEMPRDIVLLSKLDAGHWKGTPFHEENHAAFRRPEFIDWRTNNIAFSYSMQPEIAESATGDSSRFTERSANQWMCLDAIDELRYLLAIITISRSLKEEKSIYLLNMGQYLNVTMGGSS